MHRLDVVRRPSPVATGRQVAEPKRRGVARSSASSAGTDLAGDELRAPPGALMVEEDARRHEHVVGLAVVDGRRVCEQLGASVRRARVERPARRELRRLERVAEHL